MRPVGGGLVTLGSGLTVRGGSGTLGGPTGTVLNLGTVNADVAGRTIIITGAGFENRGLIAATGGGLAVQTLTMNGGTIFAAAGKTVTVSGNLALGATDTVVTELAGLSNVGLLAVTGTASVAGTLDVRLATGFTPSVGQRFRIMTFASRSGLFGTLLGTDPGGGVALTLDPGDPVDFELAAVAE